MKVGWVGLGHMGEPMASRLAAAGCDLTVWNRSAAAARRLADRGVAVARTPAELFDACDVAILMLANGTVVDEVLGRHDTGFAVPLRGRLVVNMGTVAPSYSTDLAHQLRACGGRFVEAPVSGSKGPAAAGQLVAMLAGESGETGDLDLVERLVAPMTASVVRCGAVPRALEAKLAVNTFLINLATGLAESVAFAERRGVDLALLRTILDAGPMASTVSRGKLAKLAEGDLSAQAAISDVRYNSRLIVEAADEVGARIPLLRHGDQLLADTEAQGWGAEDMIAVIKALRAP